MLMNAGVQPLGGALDQRRHMQRRFLSAELTGSTSRSSRAGAGPRQPRIWRAVVCCVGRWSMSMTA